MEKGFVEENQVDTEVVKCENCGSNMVFHPDTQSLICPHCQSAKNFGISTFNKEVDLLSGLNDDSVWKKEEVLCYLEQDVGHRMEVMNDIKRNLQIIENVIEILG